jgi:hypothetical protein
MQTQSDDEFIDWVLTQAWRGFVRRFLKPDSDDAPLTWRVGRIEDVGADIRYCMLRYKKQLEREQAHADRTKDASGRHDPGE